MTKNIIRKEKIIHEIQHLLHVKLITAVVNFSKVTSFDLKVIRQELKRQDICLKVVKNTLVKKALTNINNNELINYISGQKLLVFSNELKSLVQVLQHISKLHNNFKVSCLYLYGRIYFDDYYELGDIGTIEDVLIKLIFVLKTPIIKFINSIKYPYMQLPLVLKTLQINIKETQNVYEK